MDLGLELLASRARMMPATALMSLSETRVKSGALGTRATRLELRDCWSRFRCGDMTLAERAMAVCEKIVDPVSAKSCEFSLKDETMAPFSSVLDAKSYGKGAAKMRPVVPLDYYRSVSWMVPLIHM
jgi:hypothetical protein